MADSATSSSDSHSTHLVLPAPTGAHDASKLQLSSDELTKLSFDTLGPMVVNSDGTLSRITNWENMITLERERTIRVLNARNKLRLGNEQEKSQDKREELLSILEDVNTGPTANPTEHQ